MFLTGLKSYNFLDRLVFRKRLETQKVEINFIYKAKSEIIFVNADAEQMLQKRSWYNFKSSQLTNLDFSR